MLKFNSESADCTDYTDLETKEEYEQEFTLCSLPLAQLLKLVCVIGAIVGYEGGLY